ncbi:polysaccharide lyase 6 family protein [Niabella beijingensis]|uniref:polysaccharide lyase 6 family protein n=1 Tax=Niabella beijingensis TaxID=2872700 RepID=UPI001CBFA053|nr:polysaccharide lyase 6 family protein [Niabella beijingensis]MBZ4188724.1 polysaccharide lyase 6 family protein [Niabella beijingensis]
MWQNKIGFGALLCLLCSWKTGSGNTILVHTVDELKQQRSLVQPGDTVLLADKEWRDAVLDLEMDGTKEQPVVVRPQTMGKAVFTGRSAIRIGGQYLLVSGLYFKNGSTPGNAVIEFRTPGGKLANNSRVTQCVIENYSQPGRFTADVWVVLWGKRNRVDHCIFKDKLNAGPVLIVELNDERSQHNEHLVDSNYFAGRQRFGANGGETIRIGVSRYSLTASRTQIRANYFERCNGEVEIVSVKSGENKISNNTFFECEGSVVLRHGAGNVVSNNIFLGNNKPFTGGVRIINPGHTVTNNLFKELKGTGFRSALAVMNGVPNSLINRYFQVTDVAISHNTFISCSSPLFGAGKDAERTLSPQRTRFTGNLIVGAEGALYEDANDDKGIQFRDNGVAGTRRATYPQGFRAVGVADHVLGKLHVKLNEKYGVLPDQLSEMNAGNTGAGWYRPEPMQAVRPPRVFTISPRDIPGLDQILQQMHPNDTLMLGEGGIYRLCRPIAVDKPLAVVAAPGLSSRPVLVNGCDKSMTAHVVIENGGALFIKGIAFDGAYESFGAVTAGIRSSEKPMNRHYKLHIDDCAFYNFNESSHAGFAGTKSTYADSILITNSLFRNISGTAVNLAEEKEDKGYYGAEYLVVKNTVFTNILGSAINVYRGGNDESTTGPFATIDHCTFNEVENREQGTAVRLAGVQYARITNSNFVNSGSGGRVIEFREFRNDPLWVDHCNFYNCGRLESFYNKVSGPHIYKIKPVFSNPAVFDFNLKKPSDLQGKSSDGKTIGAAW